MSLIGRVFLMALCVLTAYALPSISSFESNVLKMRAAPAAVAIPPAVNNTQDKCIASYSQNIAQINNLTVINTQHCYKRAQDAFSEYNKQVLNTTVAEVNALSKKLQLSLANCSAQKTNADILLCFTNTFESNINNLGNLTSQSVLVGRSINEYEYAVEVDTKMCINQSIIGSRVNSSIATNNLQICLNNTTLGGVGGLRSDLKTQTFALN